MAKYLVTFSEEIDGIEINGFITMTDKEVENYEELATSITWDFSYKVSNKKLTFSSGDDLLNRLDFKEISNEEHKTFKKVFDSKFGVFIDEDYLQKVIGETDDVETDEDEEEDFYPNYPSDDDDDDNY